MDMETNPLKLLCGATVGWRGLNGEIYTGQVGSYRQVRGHFVMHIIRPDGKTLRQVVSEVEPGATDDFCIINHGPESIEYGLRLADLILQGKACRVPINHQMTTLAATALALQAQYKDLCEQHARTAAADTPAAKAAKA